VKKYGGAQQVRARTLRVIAANKRFGFVWVCFFSVLFLIFKSSFFFSFAFD